MAEFCLDCWNEINDIQLTTEDVIINKNLDLCEGRGEMKHTITCYKKEILLIQFIRHFFRND